MQDRTRKLWGQEFDVVRGGMSEDQVVRFVNDLLRKYRVLAEQQQHLLSLGTLSEKAAVEAGKLAADIKGRAQREAVRNFFMVDLLLTYHSPLTC